MPRKKQKGVPSHQLRGGASSKPGSAPVSQSKTKAFGPQSKPGKSAKDSDQKKQPLQKNQKPTVPFLRKDRILLIGEGDFSFARSLATQYKCRNLCATCYDSKETLFSKYPQAQQNIHEILNASKSSIQPQVVVSDAEEEGHAQAANPHQQRASGPKVLFSVDARKLGGPTGGGKEVRMGFRRRERKKPAWKTRQPPLPLPQAAQDGPWDVICFNFPHVGGLSTDVNRQVRHNQELLVAFFNACVPLLSAAPENPVDSDDEWEFDDDEDNSSETDEKDEEDDDGRASRKGTRTGPGQILVSLFEAEPYTLWNIKDLARHAGLQVVTSFKFPWNSYRGYSHARTLGEVEGKNGGRGGWRGEDREARMYVFQAKNDAAQAVKPKKRAREDSSDSE